ncbi:MAG: hypothetical protein HUJ68_10445 [Clostridia bacterium]|nr:hypothetical protein [Clostridia bacterium]
MYNLKNKPVVFWGAGTIGEKCLEQYQNISPQFVIDNYQNKKMICGKQIYSVEEIDSINNYYIVITVNNDESIVNFLDSRGLIEEIDYVSYRKYFNLNIKKKTLDEIGLNYKSIYSADICKPLIVMPTTNQRMDCVFDFYNSKFGIGKYVVFTELMFFSEAQLSKKYNTSVYENPFCFKVNKIEVVNKYEKEMDAIEKLIFSFSVEEYRNVVYAGYSCYKKILKFMKPKYIWAWGGWFIENHLLKIVADEIEIPFRFVEFGEIPGTILIDRCGIEGHSEYVLDSTKLKEIEVDEKSTSKTEKVFEYIKKSKIDSIKFKNNEIEQDQLDRITKNKKIVFFVGMDDNGLGFNPNAPLWDRYVSNLFKSSSDAAYFLKEICDKNDWTFIYKAHPNTKFSIAEAESAFFELDIDTLIQKADVVVSFKSKSDYKALINGKPLVQIGYSMLTNKECGYQVEKKEDIEKKINEALKYGFTKKQKSNFVKHVTQLLKVHLWDDSIDRPLRYGQIDI